MNFNEEHVRWEKPRNKQQQQQQERTKNERRVIKINYMK